MTDAIAEKLESFFHSNVDANIDLIKEILGTNADLAVREFTFHLDEELKAVAFYTDGLTNTQEVEKTIKSLIYEANQLVEHNDQKIKKSFEQWIKMDVLSNPSIRLITKIQEGIDAILSGDSIVLFDHFEKALLIASKGWESRSVDEPATEQVVRGPRDGFTESIRTNTSLVRRRIKDPLLRIEEMTIGKKSKTSVNIAYLQGTVKEGLVEEVKNRLKKIKIDAVLESGYIEELIEDAPYSPFATIQSTERPDKVAASILEGRVAIFVDNTPFVLIVPTYFWQFLQASDDYYSKFWTGSFFRIIRFAAFIISLTLTSLYVMLASFHQEMIPTTLALTIASGREVVPMPVLMEALLMELTFELMREAGLRMPKPVGQAVSIVGSLIIGQAAVQAGIVSPFMVIIVATTGIASFAVPNYAASYSIRLIRFPLLIASGTLGLLGFSVMFALLAIHALSLRSFGEPYLAPASPFKPSDQKDAVIRFPWWSMKKQPELAEGQENRLGENQLPKPEKENNQSTSILPKKNKSSQESNKETSPTQKQKVRRIPKKEWMKKDDQ